MQLYQKVCKNPSRLVAAVQVKKPEAAVSSVAFVLVVVVLLLMLVATFYYYRNSSVQNTTKTTTVTLTNVAAASTETVYQSSPSNSSQLGLNTVAIYNSTRPSIVTVEGTQTQTNVFGNTQVAVLGSGFVVVQNNAYYIVTNYHVAGATSNLTVTFSDGDAYPATVIGSDPYSDLAILSVTSASLTEFHPLNFTSSLSLKVGVPVVAIGNPFGLSGSMTFGIVSQLGRTIQDQTAGNFSIANVIQFSAPINPGNSGGALLNAEGDVVGITTATVSSSQGIGFAIPSDTILKELPSLISTGTYSQHSYLGIGGADMDYILAKASGTNTTYGVLIESVVPGGPAATAGLKGGGATVIDNGQQVEIGGDIVVSVNGTKITDNDALASYLEEYTVSGQTAMLGIIRGGNYMTIPITLGTRPPL
jgi:S1-C subfamily serine protease